MVDIRNYLKLSPTAQKIFHIYTNPKDFSSDFSAIKVSEVKSYLRHFIINNKPFAFDKFPIIFEQVTQYFADNVGINPAQIKLIGSAKTGFSISDLNYGRLYESSKSDLDFSIVSEELFYQIENEFEKWADLYKNNQISPMPNREIDYWPKNLETGPKQLRRGFIDSKYIPNRSQFPKTCNINSSLYYIKKYLGDINGINIKEASARIYKNWDIFIQCLKINTESVLKKIN